MSQGSWVEGLKVGEPGKVFGFFPGGLGLVERNPSLSQMIYRAWIIEDEQLIQVIDLRFVRVTYLAAATFIEPAAVSMVAKDRQADVIRRYGQDPEEVAGIGQQLFQIEGRDGAMNYVVAAWCDVIERGPDPRL